jgi:hypothetical protein
VRGARDGREGLRSGRRDSCRSARSGALRAGSGRTASLADFASAGGGGDAGAGSSSSSKSSDEIGASADGFAPRSMPNRSSARVSQESSSPPEPARNGSAFIGGLSRSSSELAANHVGEEASPTAAIGKH